MNILLVIFLVFLSFVTSTPIRRQDALNGFKQCQGDLPNEITAISFSPMPLVAGQGATVRIVGIPTVTIENGALYKITGFDKNTQIQLFHRELNFCDVIVTPSGFSCPVKNNFDFTAKFVEQSTPNDPKNTVKEYLLRIQITNPNGKDLSCIEGNIKISYP